MAPATGTVDTPISVIWGSVGFGPYVSDVQVKTAGAGAWAAWQTGVQTTGASYTPAVAGTYAFRARVRNGAYTKWSPVAAVAVA
jgi:hypothetical protein